MSNFTGMSKRILFLADIDSSHTQKWAVSLHKKGFEIGIFSIRKSTAEWYYQYPDIRIYDAHGFGKDKFGKNALTKIDYLKLVPELKDAIVEFAPDILHAHYATSYGLLGVRTGFHPLIISVWGSDVFEFPQKSIVHRYIVKRNLRKADFVFSTSEVMKAEVVKLGRADVVVTPFGVDLSAYKRFEVPPLFDHETKVIGTIKTLEPHYGIGALIMAFDVVRKNYSGKVKLVICGDGSEEQELKTLVKVMGMDNDVLFTGTIPQSDVPKYLNAFDVFANLSLRESFGVSILEAMACEVPVVLSDVDGPKEISRDGKFGSMISGSDPGAAAQAMLKLLNEPEFAREQVAKAYEHVRLNYDWDKNLDYIVAQYKKIEPHKK